MTTYPRSERVIRLPLRIKIIFFMVTLFIFSKIIISSKASIF